mmetsp:Transcript_4262/g.6212  ORF Transcript_4262/g.6212 Transcript_4262/m.6212 type:complete len:246 (-) Transcript_4262:358-1095(-)
MIALRTPNMPGTPTTIQCTPQLIPQIRHAMLLLLLWWTRRRLAATRIGKGESRSRRPRWAMVEILWWMLTSAIVVVVIAAIGVLEAERGSGRWRWTTKMVSRITRMRWWWRKLSMMMMMMLMLIVIIVLCNKRIPHTWQMLLLLRSWGKPRRRSLPMKWCIRIVIRRSRRRGTIAATVHLKMIVIYSTEWCGAHIGNVGPAVDARFADVGIGFRQFGRGRSCLAQNRAAVFEAAWRFKGDNVHQG